MLFCQLGTFLAKKCRGGSVEPSQPGASDRVVCLAKGVRGDHPHLNLFTMRANDKLPLYVSPVLDPIAWGQDGFQHSWDNL